MTTYFTYSLTRRTRQDNQLPDIPNISNCGTVVANYICREEINQTIRTWGDCTQVVSKNNRAIGQIPPAPKITITVRRWWQRGENNNRRPLEVTANPNGFAFLFSERKTLWHTPFHATQHVFHAAAGHLFHHFLHLGKLLEQAIYVLDLGSGTCSNSPAP